MNTNEDQQYVKYVYQPYCYMKMYVVSIIDEIIGIADVPVVCCLHL